MTNTIDAVIKINKEVNKENENEKEQAPIDYLIFFALSLMVSPLTKIPLPLYGSGRLH